MVFSPLSELKPNEWHHTIHVRICRKWEYHGPNENNPLQHIDLILADKQGNIIYAEIAAEDADTHGNTIVVGQTYVISRFKISKSKTFYRAVPGPYMVRFTCHTKISIAREAIIEPKYVYTLTPFEKLPQYANDTSQFHDVLSIVTEINEPYWYSFSDQRDPSLRRDIKIKNESQEIKLVLWGSKASQFDIPQNLNEDNKPVTILFTGCLVKYYSHELQISGYSACHWYINPDIPEAISLLNSLHNQFCNIKREGVPLADQNKPDPPTLPDHLTLREMQDIDPYEFPTTGCRCTVTIIRLAETYEWWYPACRLCNKSCQPDGSTYRCPKCDNTNYTYKYKLPFIASDGTEEAEMIAFAGIAQRIVGKPVESQMRSHRNTNNIPPDIAAIVSSKFTFSVTMSETSFTKPKKSYQVRAILDVHGKQLGLPLHCPNQKNLNTANIRQYHQSNEDIASASRFDYSSHSRPTISPTKALLLGEMALQTPPKRTEAQLDYNKKQLSLDAQTSSEAKTIKKRLYTPQDEEEQIDTELLSPTVPDKEKAVDTPSHSERIPKHQTGSSASKNTAAKLPRSPKKKQH